MRQSKKGELRTPAEELDETDSGGGGGERERERKETEKAEMGRSLLQAIPLRQHN